MKKLYFFFLLLPLWGMGGFSSAQVSVSNMRADYAAKKITFTVSWTAAPENNKIWLLADYRKIENNAETGSWSRAPIAAASKTAGVGTASTVSGNTQGFWLNTSGSSGSATVEATLTLPGGVAQFNWCAYAFNTPPYAAINPAGGYILHGTPPFTVNNVKLADGVKTFGAGTCITSITDFTGNPAGVIPPAPSVTTTNPATICYNTTAALSCTVSGGTTTAMTYTWKIGTATTTTTAPSVTSASLISATTYNVTVTNANGCASTVSNTGTIPVASSFSQNNPSAATICYNATATFSLAAASGGVGAITYRWEQSSDNSSWATASGTNNTAAYTTPALTSASYYRRAAVSANCGTITSSGAYVTVRTNFTAGSITSATVSTTPGTAPTANPTNATAASGGDTAITYEWRRTGTSEKTLTGSTSDYTLSSDNSNYSTAGTYYFTRYAKDGTCNPSFTASSGQYTLWVASPPPPGAGTNTYICGTQTWSEPVRIAACDKSSFVYGYDTQDCRSYTWNGIKYFYYNWTYVSANEGEMCPAPWRVPVVADFDNLTTCLGNTKFDGVYYGETSTWGGALAGGTQGSDMADVGAVGNYWTATEINWSHAYRFRVSSANAGTMDRTRYWGLQVRCVK